MSEIGPSESEKDIKRSIDELVDINDQISKLRDYKKELTASLYTRIKAIRAENLPREDRYLLASLFHNKDGSAEKIKSDAEKLLAVDDQLRASAGQMIAWIDVDTRVVMYRDPGPNEEETDHYFNIGLLPQDARLDVYFNNSPKVTVGKAARIPFHVFPDLDPEVTWEGVASVNIPTSIYAAVRHDNPEFFIKPDGVIGYANGKIQKLPLPLIGDEAVKALLDEPRLAMRGNVLDALDLLAA
jgi:hypothetical protein